MGCFGGFKFDFQSQKKKFDFQYVSFVSMEFSSCEKKKKSYMRGEQITNPNVKKNGK